MLLDSAREKTQWLSPVRSLVICFAVLAVVIAGTNPLVEMPINDDFSYTRVAQLAAETGQLVYSGWGSPFIGFQAYWTAVFIKLFGFSFQVVRFSAIPFTFGCAAILLSFFHRARVHPVTALFGVLAIMLSPVMIPVEPTYMTDIPSQFFVLLILWCADRTVHSSSEPGWRGWLTATVLSGLAGSSIRQTVVIAVCVCLPFIAWHTAKRSQAIIALLCLLGTLACMAGLTYWYKNQPYGVPLPLIDRANYRGYRPILFNALATLIELPLIVLPVLMLTFSRWRKLSLAAHSAFLAAAAGGGACFWYIWREYPRIPKIPFGYLVGNMVTQWGLLGENVEILGRKPLIFRNSIQAALISLTVLVFLATFFSFVRELPDWRSSRPYKTLSRDHSGITLLILFAFVYLLPVLFRFYVGYAVDRYLIPLLPAVVLAICLLPGVRDRSPNIAAWSFLAVASLFGVGLTHDYFSESRARLAAATESVNAGIARTEISAGFEYDMWTQLENARYINDPMISNPPNAFVRVDSSASLLQPPYWGWSFTPAITPKYVIVLSPQPGLVNAGLPPVPFSRWLCPDGQVLIQTGAHQR